jgi:hypothetical protein
VALPGIGEIVRQHPGRRPFYPGQEDARDRLASEALDLQVRDLEPLGMGRWQDSESKAFEG